MRYSFGCLALIVIAVGACVRSGQAAPKTYYVAPTGGSDLNSGTDIGMPFATIPKAISSAIAGDTIYLRGGTFNLSSNISTGSSKVGTAANSYNLFAYPGESPVLDFRGETYSATNSGARGLTVNGGYWHVKGLTIQYAADNGVNVSGSNNTIEQVVARQNQDSGFIISGTQPSNNVFLNCDSYGNFDFGAAGENADGFAIKFRGLGPGNMIIGARAYDNADDGFDFWQAEHGVTVINSWAFHNGKASVFNNPASFAGDGNGIKLGHDSGTHLIENMLVWGNPANGVDINGNATQLEINSVPALIPHGVTIYNVTATGNGGKNFNFDEDPTTASPPTTHVLKNNVSYTGSATINSGNAADHNTFAGAGGSPTGLGATAADFVSTVDPLLTEGSFHPAGTGGDRSGATTPVYATGLAVGPRKADGSLPDIDFMRLIAGSHLIDAGVNVGLPFNGSSPDLGYFETATIVPPPIPGDYNGDRVVDAADYTVWRDTMGQIGAGLAADGDGSGTIDQGDYDTWVTNFGRTSGSGSLSSGTVGVPEPSSWLLFVISAISLVAGRRNRPGWPGYLSSSASR